MNLTTYRPGDDEGRGVYFAKKTNSYYISGKTNSKSGISTSKGIVHSSTLNSNLGGTNNSSTDGFISHITSRGDTLWFSYYGGQGNDDAVDVVIDDYNYIYLCGTTASNNCQNTGCSTGLKNIIASSDAFKKVRDADEAYVAKFDSKGKRVWSTYFGGKNNEVAAGLSHGRFGDVYLVGYTDSDDGLIKKAFQDTFGGATDAYYADILYCKKFAVLKKDTVCYGDTFSINFVDSANYFKWWFQVANAKISTSIIVN